MSDGEELSGVGRTSGARNAYVAGLMKRAVELGRCPFCSPYFEEKNGEGVVAVKCVAESLYWKVWHNPSPFEGTSHHIMLAPNRHVMSASELTSDELLEFASLTADLQLELGYASYTVFSRQGDPAYNSATVFHLHYHIVVSSGEPANIETIPYYFLELIEEVLERIDVHVRVKGEDRLELLDNLRSYIDVYREAELGKAVPIRAKFSNKVGHNRLDQST